MVDPDTIAAVMILCFSFMVYCCHQVTNKKYCGGLILLSALLTGYAWYLFPGGNWLGYLIVSFITMGAVVAGIAWGQSKRNTE